MFTYYCNKLHPSASDSNAGTSASAPFLTFAKLLSMLTTAGDIGIVAGGAVYREGGVLGYSGSSGYVIKVIFDIDGLFTGYVGETQISAYDNDLQAPIRASCLDLNGKTFVEIYNGMFVGGTSFPVGNSAFASATAYEGVKLIDCEIVATDETPSVNVDLNGGVTPTTTGLQITRCNCHGGINIDWDSNGSAHVNSKITIDGCFILALAGQSAIDLSRTTNGGALSVGGFTVKNNTVIGGGSYNINLLNQTNTSNPSYVMNNAVIHGSAAGIAALSATAGAVIAGSNRFMSCSPQYSGTITILPDNETSGWNSPILLGGFNDRLRRKVRGNSHFSFGEPRSLAGYTNPLIGTGSNDYLGSDAVDIYGNKRPAGRPTSYMHQYYFDGSDATTTGTSWGSPTNATDASVSTYAFTSTSGGDSANFLKAEGTNAPSSGNTITKVQARFLCALNSGSTATPIEVKVYSDSLGELLATLSKSPSSTTPVWSDLADLNTPSGGWDWAKVGALELKGYRVSGSLTVRIYQIQIAVYTAECGQDIGAVEHNPGGSDETTTVYSGTHALRLDEGTAFHDLQRAVAAGTTLTVSVRAQFDASYSGSKPKLTVTLEDGSVYTDTMSGSTPGTWEELTITTGTIAADGVAWVRLESQDTSVDGSCIFSGLVFTVG